MRKGILVTLVASLPVLICPGLLLGRDAGSYAGTTQGPILATYPATIVEFGQARISELETEARFDHPAYTRMIQGVNTDRVVVRFLPHTTARVRNGALVSRSGADLSRVSAVVASLSGAVLGPRFPQSEDYLDELRARGEALSRRSLPDLNLYAQIDLPASSSLPEAESRLRGLLAALMESDGVAAAWAEPLVASAREVGGLAEPRAVGGTVLWPGDQDSHPESGESSAGNHAHSSSTPDFSSQQGYLYSPPVGIDAPYAWGQPGGLGQGVDFIDIEWGWLWAHEDIPEPFYTAGDYDTSDHGTAVVGEVSAPHNGYGVNGISPGVRTGAVSLNTYSVSGGITEAAAALDPGDIFLMEVQCGGPTGWMPCEWWQDVYDAISVATANGIICVEAGGNGTVDLDHPLFGGAFDRHVRDSKAIMVGAGTPTGLNAEWFTNYGTRVDLQGWGSAIVTTGYGDLQGGHPEVRYTAGFNGTSGASPIVTGALASLQGQSLALYGVVLTPDLASEILSVTGSPWAGERQIGERPNLRLARDRLLLGFGDVTVRVREGGTMEPLPGRIVRIAETGRMDRTGPNGEVLMQLSATDVTFVVEGDFYHQFVEYPYTVLQGQSQTVIIDMTSSPTEAITGIVRGEAGQALEGARVEIAGAPLEPVLTGPNGIFLLPGVPAGGEHDLIAYGIPEHGVSYARLPVVEGETALWNPALLLAETFEGSNGGYTALGQWQWGVPTYPSSDPVPAFSGSKVWGVNLHAPYGDLRTSVLIAPVIDARDAAHVHLSFHHWYLIGEGDGGQVQVREQGQTNWIVVSPVGGYPVESIAILSNTGGYSGTTGGEYSPAVFDLSWWAGSLIEIRLWFRSDESGNGPGWYIDDVIVDLGEGLPASAEESPPGEPFDARASSGVRLLGASPNPFRESSQITFSLASRGKARVELYSPDGGLVRTLDLGDCAPGVHRVQWDGIGENGRSLGSGVYFYIVRTRDAQGEGRIIRVR